MEKKCWMGCAVIALFLMMVASPAVHAKEAKKTSSSGEASGLSTTERAAKEAEAAALLNGTKWSIELIPLSGEKQKRSSRDTLKFENGKITSEAMSKQGYPTTNFTLSLNGNTTVWETMQTKEGSGVAFWRGERQGEAMRGILSKHPAEGASVDLSFSGKLVEAKPSTPPPSGVPTSSSEETTTPLAGSSKVPVVQGPIASVPSVEANHSSSETGTPSTTSSASPKKASSKKGWW